MSASHVVSRVLDRVLGRGAHAVTVPPMDGPLQPNDLLDRATALARVASPDNLTPWRGQALFSSGPDLRAMALDTGAVTHVAHMEGEVCAIAAVDAEDAVVALANGGLHRIGAGGRPLSVTRMADPDQRPICCVTALLSDPHGRLLATEGSREHLPAQWRTDLLRRRATGALWLIDGGTARPLATGLAWPAGVAQHRDGSIVVSEAWAHRLVRIDAQGRRTVVLGDLPGYPSRMAPASDGGWWLSLFAPRSQLVEFVLRERAYREEMMAQIDERYWVAPALSSGEDFREPMQGGGIKSMGILKPWAPTRSYGLVCKLDADFQPAWSAHSRADGQRHGVTSVLEMHGKLLVACQGGGEIVSLAPQQDGRPA